jgi:hypothetical protein
MAVLAGARRLFAGKTAGGTATPVQVRAIPGLSPPSPPSGPLLRSSSCQPRARCLQLARDIVRLIRHDSSHVSR